MNDSNDQELERLLMAARDLLNKSRGYGPTTDEERQAKSLVNKAKKLAAVTRNSHLRIMWVDLNYQLKGVKVRVPKPNPHRSFSGVQDPRSYGRGGLADSYEPDGEEMSEQSGRMASIAAAAKKIGAGSKQSAPKQSGSFAAFFKTKEDSTFATNALRFRTEAEAEAYARNLFMRWLGASEWKVMPHTDKPNYEIVNNELRAIKESSDDHDDWLMIKPKFDEAEKVLKTSKSQLEVVRKLKNLASVVGTLGGIQDEGGKFAKEIRDVADGIDELEGGEFDAGQYRQEYLTDLKVTRNRIQRFIEVQRRVEDSYQPSGESIQEDEWGGGFQTSADAHREVQAGLKADMQRERAKILKLVVQVIRGQITKQKFKELTGRSYDDVMDTKFRRNWFVNQVKRMSRKALAPVNQPSFSGLQDPRSYGRGGLADSYEPDGGDIQEKVEIDGRTRAYRNTVMRLEQARKLRGGRATEMQENKFGGLYDDGSGKGAFIPAPVDFNFQEAMRIVERYRSLREKKKTLFGAPKDKMEDLNAAVAMKNGKFSMGEAEMSPKQKEYRKFFAKALKKFGKDSPADMSDDEKKKFFDWLKDNWKG